MAFYMVPVLGRWLVHAPLADSTALVNATAAAWLRAGRRTGGPDRWSEFCAALTAEQPGLVETREAGLNPQFLGLVTTRACNLACVYCGFAAGGARGHMATATAVAAIDWMAQRMHDLGRKRLEVHFFGGEPSVAWDVLEVAVHRTRAAAARHGLCPRLEIATNGVFDAPRARFLGDYFDTVVLSFDGPQEIQDRHRPACRGRGSFEAVALTARRLSESPTELCLRICVTEETVGRLEEITSWFCQTFRPSTLTYETLRPTAESAAAGLEPPDPYEFAAHSLRARKVAAGYGVRALYAAALTDARHFSFCPVGNDSLIVLPDGRVCACYLPAREWEARGLDLELGRLTSDGAMNLDLGAAARLRRLVRDKPRCRSCFCRWSCAGGCYVDHSFPGCPETYDGFCIQTRLITTCSLLWELGYGDLVESFLRDRRAMERLAMQPSDQPEDCEDAVA